MFIKHRFIELSVNELKHFKNPLRPRDSQVTDFIDCDGKSEEIPGCILNSILNPVFSGKVSGHQIHDHGKLGLASPMPNQ